MTAIIPLYAREIVLRTGVYSKDLTERPVIVMKSRERMNRARRMERGSGARAQRCSRRDTIGQSETAKICDIRARPIRESHDV